MENMEKTTSFLPELQNAAGRYDYPMTNDYMFRALCQKNNKALKGLLSALLHIPVEQFQSVIITNPIVLGEECTDKEFRLDVLVDLNRDRTIDLEMQVRNFHDWPQRSISYLSRLYDNLTHGSQYADAKTAIHIGILDFTLFPENPSFYSCNKIMDEKTYHIYSDKFAINVLDLSKVRHATDEDKKWKLDYWARLFKATTWEEIKMIASNDEYLKEASNTLYTLNSDFNIRERCRNREDYYNMIANYEETINQQNAKLEEKDVKLAERDVKLAEQKEQLAEKEARLEEKDTKLAEKENEIEQLRAQLKEFQEKQRGTV